ncbi:hypothetical protein FRB99_007496 [Tulasnella sp. 403]|nr:hypothetical protein FRB99_007496 [Tulasnella sp. 403]
MSLIPSSVIGYFPIKELGQKGEKTIFFTTVASLRSPEYALSATLEIPTHAAKGILAYTSVYLRGDLVVTPKGLVINADPSSVEGVDGGPGHNSRRRAPLFTFMGIFQDVMSTEPSVYAFRLSIDQRDGGPNNLMFTSDLAPNTITALPKNALLLVEALFWFENNHLGTIHFDTQKISVIHAPPPGEAWYHETDEEMLAKGLFRLAIQDNLHSTKNVSLGQQIQDTSTKLQLPRRTPHLLPSGPDRNETSPHNTTPPSIHPGRPSRAMGRDGIQLNTADIEGHVTESLQSSTPDRRPQTPETPGRGNALPYSTQSKDQDSTSGSARWKVAQLLFSPRTPTSNRYTTSPSDVTPKRASRPALGSPMRALSLVREHFHVGQSSSTKGKEKAGSGTSRMDLPALRACQDGTTTSHARPGFSAGKGADYSLVTPSHSLSTPYDPMSDPPLFNDPPFAVMRTEAPATMPLTNPLETPYPPWNVASLPPVEPSGSAMQPVSSGEGSGASGQIATMAASAYELVNAVPAAPGHGLATEFGPDLQDLVDGGSTASNESQEGSNSDVFEGVSYEKKRSADHFKVDEEDEERMSKRRCK